MLKAGEKRVLVVGGHAGFVGGMGGVFEGRGGAWSRAARAPRPRPWRGAWACAPGGGRVNESGAMGFFISFEGIEGSGKTTQVAMLDRALQAAGRKVIATREPGGARGGGA